MERFQVLMFKKYRDMIMNFMRKGLSPSETALGFALGNFIGILPFLGLHTVIAFGLAYLFRLNTLVVFLGTQISNPFSFPFILFISAQFGNLILKGSLLNLKVTADISIIKYYIMPTILGSLVLGSVFSIVSYFIVLKFARRYRT